jgi:hypothetical protein
MKEFGLNTEESILITKLLLTPEQKIFLNSSFAFSLRTFNNNDNAPHPHYPIINKYSLLDLMPKLLNAGYSLIVAKCIDPKFAELTGCGYKRGQSVTFEIKFGAVTVRSVTHDGLIDKTFTTGIGEQCNADYRLAGILAEIRRCPVTDCIFEFSWYSMPVGRRQQQAIFWEIIGDAEKDLIKMDGVL